MYFKEIENYNSKLSWSKFYLQLGRYIYNFIQNYSEPQHIAINMPYTNYCSHIVALGILDSLYSDVAIATQHNNILDQLEPGMLVFYQPKPDSPEVTHTYDGQTEEGYPILKTKGKNPVRNVIKKDWDVKIRVATTQRRYKRNRSLGNQSLQTLKAKYDSNTIDNISRSNPLSIIIIGNEKQLKEESYLEIDGISLNELLLMKHFVREQEFYITKIISSRSLSDLEIKSDKTFIIYTSLESFNNFYDELSMYPSVFLFNNQSESFYKLDVLETLNKIIDKQPPSNDFDISSLEIPKGIEIITWEGE